MKKFLIIALFVTIMSCEVVVDVPMPDFESSLVLNCYFNPDSAIALILTSNKSVLDNRDYFPIVTGARVLLHEAGSLVGELKEDSVPSLYRADFIPKPGLEYTVTAEKNGFKTISATAQAPLNQAAFTVGELEESYSEYGQHQLELPVTLMDDPGKDYYEVKLYLWMDRYDYEYNEEEDSLYIHYRGKVAREQYFKMKNANIKDFGQSESKTLFSDELFDGKQSEFTIVYQDGHYWPGGSEQDTLQEYTLQIRHVSEEYYRYIVSVDLQYEIGGDPFSEPVQVFNNIENGFGIFTGYNSSSYEFEVVRKEEN